MKIKPQQYWAIIITLLFHAVVFWLLFFAELTKSKQKKEYELELNPNVLEEMKALEQQKLKELAEQEVNKMLSSKAAKRAVGNEDIEQSTEILQEEFQQRKQQTDALKKAPEKSKIEIVKEKAEEKNDSVAKKQTVFYVGKSRVEYFLAERYRVELPIPVYKCEGAGTVEIEISVNRKGVVVDAEVVKNRSRSASECMQDAALTAALSSVFSERPEALVVQKGRIVYSFAAQ